MNQQNSTDKIRDFLMKLKKMRQSTEEMEQNLYTCLDRVNCLECFLLFKLMSNPKGIAGNPPQK